MNMSNALAENLYDWNDLVESLVTEDDEPVDNLFSSKQQRLLTRSLYSSWKPQPIKKTKKQRKFLADTNVGVFFSRYEQPLVPDFFLSLDVEPHADWYTKEHRSYFVWEFGKVPELVLEIVSNRKGGEINGKLKNYARLGVLYYVVFDPLRHLSENVLTVYELGFGKRLRPRQDSQLPELELSLRLWDGVFEGKEGTWLRWYDAKGKLIQTGEERASQAEKRASKAEDELKKLKAELSQLKAKPSRKRSNP
jgi:Uma2 family endonuclease